MNEPKSDLEQSIADPIEAGIEKLRVKDFTEELVAAGLTPEKITEAHVLLGRFIDGMLDVYRLKKFQKRIPTNYVLPELQIVRDSGRLATAMNTTIVIDVEIFNRPSLDPEQVVEGVATTKLKETIKVLKLTYGDFFWQAGIEEMEHTFRQQGSGYIRVETGYDDEKDFDSPDHYEYTAQNDEFLALASKITLLSQREQTPLIQAQLALFKEQLAEVIKLRKRLEARLTPIPDRKLVLEQKRSELIAELQIVQEELRQRLVEIKQQLKNDAQDDKAMLVITHYYLSLFIYRYHKMIEKISVSESDRDVSQFIWDVRHKIFMRIKNTRSPELMKKKIQEFGSRWGVSSNMIDEKIAALGVNWLETFR